MPRRGITDSTTDSRKQRIAQKEETRRRDDELDTIRAVISNEPGRRFVYMLLSRSGVFESRWEASARGSFNAGEQNMGYFLLAQIQAADPEQYVRILAESVKRELREDEILTGLYADADKKSGASEDVRTETG